MKLFKNLHPHHFHINLLLIINIFLVILILIMIKPAFLGYKLSKQFEDINKTPSQILKSVEMLKSELLIAETNLESCKNLNQQFLMDLNKEKNISFKCKQEKDVLKYNYKQLISEYNYNLTKMKSEFEQKRRLMENELTQLKETLDSLRDNYEELAKNSANNICCKAKVDNKKIDSYIIFNNRIICSVGEKNKITC